MFPRSKLLWDRYHASLTHRFDALRIVRLKFYNPKNPGIQRFVNTREWNLNMKYSDCRASKIIWNDTKLGPVFLELNIENTLLSICVGVSVGGHLPTNFLYARENFTSFEINIVRGAAGEISYFKYGFEYKTDQKLKIAGLKLRGLNENQIIIPNFID